MQNHMSANQISAKELTYLEEMMNMEAQEVQKFKQAANEATDPQAKNLLSNIANQHQGHFQTFRNYLDQHANH